MASGDASDAPPGGAPDESSSSSSSTSELRSAYNDLRRLIPQLAAELDQLRAALREHNLWLQRYGHSATATGSGDPYAQPPPPEDLDPSTPQPPGPGAASSGGTAAAAAGSAPPPADPELPAYSEPDVPPYTGGPNSVTTGSTSTREEVAERRDTLTEWLREGEDTLREYSARFAQLGDDLGVNPPEDILGTWNEASPDNALPDYARVETREELLVGGIGEVPPPYVRGGQGSSSSAQAASAAAAAANAAEKGNGGG
jgi:hypothetical protein